VIVNELIPLLYGFENTIKAFFKISRAFRVTSNSRLRRRSSSRLRRLMPTAWKRFGAVRGQFLAPLMNGGIGNAEFTGDVCNWLAARLSKPYGFSLKFLRIGLLWHAFSSPFGIVYPKISLLHESGGSS
jgi:hypothetical protein